MTVLPRWPAAYANSAKWEGRAPSRPLVIGFVRRCLRPYANSAKWEGRGPSRPCVWRDGFLPRWPLATLFRRCRIRIVRRRIASAMRDATAPNLTVSSPTSRGQRWFCDVRHQMPILGGCQFRMCDITGLAPAAALDAYSGRMSIPHSRASGVRCGLTSAQHSGLRSSHSGINSCGILKAASLLVTPICYNTPPMHPLYRKANAQPHFTLYTLHLLCCATVALSLEF